MGRGLLSKRRSVTEMYTLGHAKWSSDTPTNPHCGSVPHLTQRAGPYLRPNEGQTGPKYSKTGPKYSKTGSTTSKTGTKLSKTGSKQGLNSVKQGLNSVKPLYSTPLGSPTRCQKRSYVHVPRVPGPVVAVHDPWMCVPGRCTRVGIQGG